MKKGKSPLENQIERQNILEEWYELSRELKKTTDRLQIIEIMLSEIEDKLESLKTKNP